MQKIYSITEARDHFTDLIRTVEQSAQTVQVTRRGEPVAVILSLENYKRLLAHQPTQDFWQAYQTWRRQWQVETWSEEEDPFADVRDPSPGRDVKLWE